MHQYLELYADERSVTTRDKVIVTLWREVKRLRCSYSLARTAREKSAALLRR